VRQHTKLHAVSFFRNIEHDIDDIAAQEYMERTPWFWLQLFSKSSS